MGDREPFTQRMDADLYERVEEVLAESNQSKADAFDEMMRWWLWARGEGEFDNRLDELLARQEETLALLREGGDEPTRAPVSPAGEPLGGSTPKADVVIDSLAEYDPTLPGSYVLSRDALAEVPDALGGGLVINPVHLDIDRYPRPVRVKKCLCVAVLRFENDGTVTEETVRDTIKRVLGTTRYADRYLSNVLELLDGPTEDEQGNAVYVLGND